MVSLPVKLSISLPVKEQPLGWQLPQPVALAGPRVSRPTRRVRALCVLCLLRVLRVLCMPADLKTLWHPAVPRRGAPVQYEVRLVLLRVLCMLCVLCVLLCAVDLLHWVRAWPGSG